MNLSGLYVIAGQGLAEDRLAELVEQAIIGGAQIVQYRDKDPAGPYYRSNAIQLRELTHRYRKILIVNDDVLLARDIGADGVHVGKHDPDVGSTRSSVGSKMIIGVSCYNNLDRATEAEKAGADYVAFGSFFPSTTKPGAIRAPVEILSQARKVLQIPVVAIGGITPANGGVLVHAGAHSLAVAHAVFGQEDARAAARQLAGLFK